MLHFVPNDVSVVVFDLDKMPLIKFTLESSSKQKQKRSHSQTSPLNDPGFLGVSSGVI